ncbi:MAG: hypothetical protein GY737_13965 [Desulfobacteraceae bacterium]|nr:hypothetical protein [Desulfobacteraceae bacterium]
MIYTARNGSCQVEAVWYGGPESVEAIKRMLFDEVEDRNGELIIAGKRFSRGNFVVQPPFGEVRELSQEDFDSRFEALEVQLEMDLA